VRRRAANGITWPVFPESGATPPVRHVPRCLVDDLEQDRIALDAPTRHHVERVLRVRAGEALELVDGAGGLAHACWEPDGHARVTARAPRAASDPGALVLAVAPPRAGRLEWLVEKACELGVGELVLLQTEHTERGPGAGRQARLERIADGALLQCRRLFRMPVREPVTLPALLARPRVGALWLGAPPRPGLPPRPARRREPLLGLVGPEGGFSDAEERLALQAGACPVALGDTVLRVETAALALAVLAAV
jgi:16S rRNA (uracil1498-N3)-methyltransferase